VRILFVSGDAGGGSFRSTLELARRLVARGHEVGLIARDRTGSPLARLHKRVVNLATKLDTTPLSRPVWHVASLMGRRPRAELELDGVTIWRSTKLENTFAFLRPRVRPEVVICSSIGRVGWRTIRRECARSGVPSVLYLREESSIAQLSVPHASPTLLLANADSHAARAAALGVDAVTIPSVISIDSYLVETSRERVLYVNPIERQGLETAFALAAACPEVLFAFSESWHLDEDDKRDLLERLSALGNTEFRSRVDDPRLLYRDASVLLAPYLFDARPRVVPEAQASGIPVLATDLPAIAEVVGPGGALVAGDAGVEEWARALRQILEPETYSRLSTAAAAHARRPEIDPENLVTQFELTMEQLVHGHGRADDRRAG
jgi:glycosyltransferase involved in cell wall biosynthesis